MSRKLRIFLGLPIAAFTLQLSAAEPQGLAKPDFPDASAVDAAQWRAASEGVASTRPVRITGLPATASLPDAHGPDRAFDAAARADQTGVWQSAAKPEGIASTKSLRPHAGSPPEKQTASPREGIVRIGPTRPAIIRVSLPEPAASATVDFPVENEPEWTTASNPAAAPVLVPVDDTPIEILPVDAEPLPIIRPNTPLAADSPPEVKPVPANVSEAQGIATLESEGVAKLQPEGVARTRQLPVPVYRQSRDVAVVAVEEPAFDAEPAEATVELAQLQPPQPELPAALPENALDLQPTPVPAPEPVAPPQLSGDERQLLSDAAIRTRRLNRPIVEISLVEPKVAADSTALPPSEPQDPSDPRLDVAKLLAAGLPAVDVYGAPWAGAHPRRYTYCFTHYPLYFEDANLERCGIGYGCMQPAASALQFVGRTAILPYQMWQVCPRDCVSTLGDCPTCHEYPHGVEIP